MSDLPSLPAFAIPEPPPSPAVRTSTSRLFGRFVEVTFGRAGRQGVRVSDLEVRYRVAMDDTSKPNRGTIELVNLDRQDIADLQAPDAYVALRVGYDVPRLIFEGHPTRGGVSWSNTGQGTVTKIEAEDGGRQYRRGYIDDAFATEQTAAAVLQAVIDASGYRVGRVDQPDPGIRFAAGLALRGPTRDVLDTLAKSWGARWFVRDGAIYWLGPDTEDTGEDVVVFDEQSDALLEEPTIRDAHTIEVKSLTVPTMRPRKRFRVDVRPVSGLYVARSVVFDGDTGYTEGTPFYTSITGRAAR